MLFSLSEILLGDIRLLTVIFDNGPEIIVLFYIGYGGSRIQLSDPVCFC